MHTHLYLRASTKDQDSNRALAQLRQFAADHSLQVAGVYSENISGTKLARPKLDLLLETARMGDVLLIESVDRLSRLSQTDWSKLKAFIESKQLKLVVADLPTSHQLVSDAGISGQILKVINSMLIDLMATMARLDQAKRVERINQGLANKRRDNPEWKPVGRTANKEKLAKVQSYLAKGTYTVEEVAKLAEVGVATVYRIKAAVKASAIE
jgi:DNA invertase Pin-like site-specific DNA recombinase